MKTVINKDTGEVLYCSFLKLFLAENEIEIEKQPTGTFYNFETQTFYDK
jgi:hypothetical protein